MLVLCFISDKAAVAIIVNLHFSNVAITKHYHLSTMHGIVSKLSLFFHFCLQLVERHGAEAERHLFRCLFSWIDFGGDGKSTGKDYHQVCLKQHRY